MSAISEELVRIFQQFKGTPLAFLQLVHDLADAPCENMLRASLSPPCRKTSTDPANCCWTCRAHLLKYGPAQNASVKVIVNGENFTLKDMYFMEYEDVVRMAWPKADTNLAWTVVYKGKRNSGSLIHGQSVELENGMVFSCMMTGNA